MAMEEGRDSSIESEPRGASALECHICWKPPSDPVATSCGHVFCWPCMHYRLRDEPNRMPCPVCGTILNRDMNILTLFATGACEVTRPSGSMYDNGVVPPRPPNPETFVPHMTPEELGLGRDASGAEMMLQHIRLETILKCLDPHSGENELARMEQEERDLQQQNSALEEEIQQLMRVRVQEQRRLQQCHQLLQQLQAHRNAYRDASRGPRMEQEERDAARGPRMEQEERDLQRQNPA